MSFPKPWAELDRAAVAEAEAWADLEQELERELERADRSCATAGSRND